MRTQAVRFLVIASLLAPACEPADGPAGLPDQVAAGLVATSVPCGTQILASVKLANDMTCVGDAIIVAADEVQIDLNGHTITGSGTGNGITVRLRSDVTIYGGTIRNFLTGIFIAQSTRVLVKGNGFTENREAVFLNGSTSSTIKENAAWQNQLRGIMIRPTASGVISRDNLVIENILTDNPSGILLFSQPDNTIKENWISGSTFAAIDMTGGGGASGNTFKENVLSASAAGFRLGTGWTGNAFRENAIGGNICGIQGPIAGNTLDQNVFSGNGSDFCI